MAIIDLTLMGMHVSLTFSELQDEKFRGILPLHDEPRSVMP